MPIARLNAKIIQVVPNLASFATPYSSGDVLGSVLAVSSAVLDQGGCAKLQSVVVADKANQKVAIDLVFFSAAPATSIGADNAAYGLADSDLSLVLGRISVQTTDYVSSGTNNAEATLRNQQLIIQAPVRVQDIYMAAISRGAPTYGSASDLIISLGFEQF